MNLDLLSSRVPYRGVRPDQVESSDPGLWQAAENVRWTPAGLQARAATGSEFLGLPTGCVSLVDSWSGTLYGDPYFVAAFRDTGGRLRVYGVAVSGGFGPVAFTGIPTNENPVVWLFNGDSILRGYSTSNPNGLPNHGVLAQAAEELGQPWMINSIVGYGLYSDAPENIDYGSPGSVPNMRLRARLARYATHYLQCVGTNDINNGQPVDTLRWRMAQHSRWARGLGLIPCQTTLSVWTAWNAAKKADLVTINTLIRNRTNVGPLTGVIDFADAWETARNSGVIRSGYSSDGVHPEPGAGFDALKAAMKTALATVPRTV